MPHSVPHISYKVPFVLKLYEKYHFKKLLISLVIIECVCTIVKED